jgi:signal transduction histidine kinase
VTRNSWVDSGSDSWVFVHPADEFTGSNVPRGLCTSLRTSPRPYGGVVIEKAAEYRWGLEPAVALLFLVVALLVSIPLDAQSVAGSLLAASAMALSRARPAVALGVAAAAVLFVLAEPQNSSIGSIWPLYLALAVVTFGAAAHGTLLTRWIAFGCAVAFGPIGALLILRSGAVPLSHGNSAVEAQLQLAGTALVAALAFAFGLVVVWFLGFRLGRSADAERLQTGSALNWIASNDPEGRDSVGDPGSGGPGLIRQLSSKQLGFDLALAVVFLVVCLITPQEGALGVVVLLGFAAALAVRRMSPAIALGLAWACAILQLVDGERVQPENTAILFVLYATAAYGGRALRWVGLASAGAGSLIAAFYLSATAGLGEAYYELVSGRIAGLALQFLFLLVLSAIVLGLSWVLGLLVRTWRLARLSRQAQATAELQRHLAQQNVAVEQERTRIARDMHDVVAHSLAVVIAQADGARYAAQGEPDARDEALRTIAVTAREALGDVRLLLTELRDGESDAAAPGIGDVDRLIEQMSNAGLLVSFREEGTPLALGQGHQIALYRIIQEALTNALRHGDSSLPVEVVCDWHDNGVTVTIRNHRQPVGSDGSATETARIGHGLPGMRERAQLAGGWLSAEPVQQFFVVTAFLPWVPAVRESMPS